MDTPDHLRTNLVAGALTSTHLTIRTLMPILLAALGSTYGLAEGPLGDLGAAYSAGATLAAVTSPLWMRSLRMRVPAVVLLLIGLAAVAGILVLRQPALLMGLFGVAGIGLGGIFALMIALLARTPDPNRSYGWQWCLGSVPGIVLVYTAPALSTPGRALWVSVGLILGVNVLMSAAALFLPSRIAPLSAPGAHRATEGSASHASAPRWPLYVGLLAVFATYAGTTGAWAFFGRIAEAEQLGGQFAGIVLAVATAASSAVSLLAGEIGQRGARPAPMSTAVVGMIATLAMLVLVPGTLGYAVGVVGSIALAGYALPLTIGIVSRLDKGGQAAGLPAAALGIGAVAGPAVAGHVYQAAGQGTMLATASGMLLVGLAAYLVAYRRAFPESSPALSDGSVIRQ